MIEFRVRLGKGQIGVGQGRFTDTKVPYISFTKLTETLTVGSDSKTYRDDSQRILVEIPTLESLLVIREMLNHVERSLLEDT